MGLKYLMGRRCSGVVRMDKFNYKFIKMTRRFDQIVIRKDDDDLEDILEE